MALAKHVEQASGLSLAILQHKLGITVNPQLTSDSEEGATYDNQEGVRISAYLPQADADWETVAISLKQTGRAYQPTAMNVHRGDYPLSWPLRLAFRRNEVESLYPLLRFLLSEEFAQELRKVGLVSLPETVRGESQGGCCAFESRRPLHFYNTLSQRRVFFYHIDGEF